MPMFPWSKEYETGIDAIDRDHWGLFALINDLHDKVDAGAYDTLGVTIQAPIDYVNVHFDREEWLMEEAGYLDLETHRLAHRRVADKVAGYQRQFEAAPEAFDLDGFLAFLSLWLSDHIIKTDMAYVPAMKAAGIDAAKSR